MIHAHPPKAEISYWFYSQNSVELKITEEKQGNRIKLIQERIERKYEESMKIESQMTDFTSRCKPMKLGENTKPQ